MKIVFPFDGSTLGGSHISSVSLSSYLVNHSQHDVIYILRNRDGLFAKFLSRNNIHFITLSGPLFVYLVKAFFFLLFSDVSIVHAHDRQMHFIWLIISKITFKKFVWHQRTPCYSRLARILSSFSDQRIAISNYVRSTLDANNVDIQIIYSPVKLDTISSTFINPVPRSSEYINTICWVANWHSRKNLTLFIQSAIIYLKEYSTNCRFVIVGKPLYPLKQDILDLIDKEGFSENFLILGILFPSWPVISASDLFVTTSIDEGMGRTIIESMLAKTPVLASDSGAHSEIIKDNTNGFLFSICSSSSPEEMADKLNFILLCLPIYVLKLQIMLMNLHEAHFQLIPMHML